MEGLEFCSVGWQSLYAGHPPPHVALNQDCIARGVDHGVPGGIFGGDVVFLGNELGLMTVAAVYEEMD